MAAQPYMPTSQRGDPWFSVGLTSSFPDLTDSGNAVLAEKIACLSATSAELHGCKVFLAPDKGDRSTAAIQLSDDPKEQLDASLRKGDQVLIFRYKGQFHALDNVHALDPSETTNGSH
jgi:hypothetical protein